MAETKAWYCDSSHTGTAEVSLHQSSLVKQTSTSYNEKSCAPRHIQLLKYVEMMRKRFYSNFSNVIAV